MQQTVSIRGYYLSPLQGFGSASASSAQSAVKNLCAFCALLRQIKSVFISGPSVVEKAETLKC
jgi:hypothetical protein